MQNRGLLSAAWAKIITCILMVCLSIVTITAIVTIKLSTDMIGENESEIYTYLTETVGLNTAAAAGVMANLYRESSFNPEAVDSAGISFGLCQWTGTRYTDFQEYCRTNGYSSTSMEGQLAFLNHELNTTQYKVLEYLQEVEDTAQGAYDAGYYFCVYYERPADTELNAVSRASLARDTYWPRYEDMITTEEFEESGLSSTAGTNTDSTAAETGSSASSDSD